MPWYKPFQICPKEAELNGPIQPRGFFCLLAVRVDNDAGGFGREDNPANEIHDRGSNGGPKSALARGRLLSGNDSHVGRRTCVKGITAP